ncbi:MAG: GNAT family N-acetyltransferase [Bacteroidota bacterium]
MPATIVTPKIKTVPVHKSRWNDLVNLFGARGACGGCWCMSWRLNHAEFEKRKGASNKRALKRLVDRNEPLGVIAYAGSEPVGWCAVAPREKFIRLENSRILKSIDDKPVWSITCLFIAKGFRRQGVSVELLKGAIKFCKSKKVKIIEGYPEEPYADKIPDAFAWKGIPASFKKAGFVVAEQRTPKRPIMRYYVR